MVISRVKGFVKDLMFRVPEELQRNHVVFSPTQQAELRESIERNYLDRGATKAKLSAEEYAASLDGQVSQRTHYNRTRIAPWLHGIRHLSGAEILEIGCGTGCSAITLVEQGAKLTGVDVDGGALQVARDRLALANLQADFRELNGSQIESLDTESFDFVIFYACLEHMTVDERLASLRQGWGKLQPGGKLVIIETPNRLWYYDSHTAGLPFFDWLPDDLAYLYSRFSQRANFRDQYREIDDERMLKFKRWGRGMSYHELDLAISPVDQLHVLSYLNAFEKTFLMKHGLTGLRYRNVLRKVSSVHPAFLQPYLDLVIEKR